MLIPTDSNRLALVTGGSGYFGSCLMHRLLQLGYECRSLDLIDSDDRPASVQFVRCDIRDRDGVGAAVRDVDIVFHNVAQVPIAKDRALFRSVNVVGTGNLLEAAHRSGVRKVVYTSSSAVFGVPASNPVTENTVPRPAEAYGAAKYAGEQMCRSYADTGLDVTIVRPRTILGEGRLGIFQILFEWIRRGLNVPVLGRGDNVYQFVHARDLADCCILASRRPGAAVYNSGTDRYGTMREGLEALCRHAGTGSRVKSVSMAAAELAMTLSSALGLSPLGAYHSLMYGRSLYFDIAKAKSELGWQPRFSNEEMLFESYDWYCSNRERVLATSQASAHRMAVRPGVLQLLRWVL